MTHRVPPRPPPLPRRREAAPGGGHRAAIRHQMRAKVEIVETLDRGSTVDASPNGIRVMLAASLDVGREYTIWISPRRGSIVVRKVRVAWQRPTGGAGLDHGLEFV
ncbi:MAG: PilZ domain-containing protein [Myxococcota bacterium]